MRVLHVGAEIHPYVKTGGLADVVAALPTALRREGADARVQGRFPLGPANQTW